MANTKLPPSSVNVSDSWRSVACRVTDAHYEIIAAADHAAGKTVAGYCRAVLVPWAASDTGAQPPDLSVYERADLVAEAARQEGISAAEFRNRAARQAAVAVLTDARPSRESDIRELLRPPARARRRAV